MRQINLLIVLMIGILLTACQPSTPPATSVTSNDSLGGISLSFPGDWTVFAEKSPIAGRQNVTLVRFPDGQEELNIDQFPVIRVSYEDRDATSLASGLSLETVAMGKAATLAPRAIFGQAVVTQVDIYPAVLLKGENSGVDRDYYFVFVDFQPEGGLVTLVLTAPDDTTPYEAALRSIAPTIRLTIKPENLIPTATIAPEETAFIFPEQTGLFGPPESTDEVAPESTASVESTSEVAPEATGEAAATEEASATEEVVATSEVGTDEAVAGTREVIATEEGGTAPTPEIIDVDPEEQIILSPSPVGTPRVVTPDASGAATMLPNTIYPSPTSLMIAQTITLDNGFTVLTLDGWISSTNNQNSVSLALGSNVEAAMLANEAVPAGEAFISVELGKAEEMFSGSIATVDLRGRLENQITATANYIPPLTYGEITELTINNRPAASILATSENYDQYTLLIDLGAGIFARLRLTTAPGEGESFIPQAMAVAESLSPAQQ